MSLPFTVDQFLGVFAAYNESIWPVQFGLNLIALLAAAFCLRRVVPSKLIAGFLAFLWLWTGIVYHIIFFSPINPVAVAFGGVFVLQGLAFLLFGTLRSGLSFGFQPTLRGWTGGIFIAYGLLIYPMLGHALGHVYPASPTFGAPCPVTIVTFGLLLWTTAPVKWYLFILPFLWSVIGFSAALTLGIREDIGLLVAGVIGSSILALPHGADVNVRA